MPGDVDGGHAAHDAPTAGCDDPLVNLVSEIAGRLLRLPAPATRELVVERDLAVTMDDGVVLLADRYAPPGTERAPTVLVRSPYGRRGAFGFLFGRLVAERGLQTVVQSIRGTFGSGGRFDPFNERADGLATLRWLRSQPWHDGPVGAIGPSYMGLVQWAIADELDALAPSVTASQFRGMAYGGGSIALDAALSWMLVLEVQEQRLAPLLLAHGLRRRLPRVYEHVPVAELDERAFGSQVEYFREWTDQMSPDSPYWSERDFSSAVGDVRAPVQLVGGWHDIFLPWMVEDFHALQAAGRRPQLIVGPWTHTAAGMTGAALRNGVGWLRAHLLGDRRLVGDSPVRVYVTGERRWRELSGWPPPARPSARSSSRRAAGCRRPRPRGRRRRAATSTTRPTRRRRSAARCCSSSGRCATTGRWRRATTCSRSRPPRSAPTSTRSARSTPTSGCARAAATPTSSCASATSSPTARRSTSATA